MTFATPNAVKELRERTGAGMMDCKKALDENQGNFDKAIEWLRTKGLSAAAKKAGRVAAEGVVTTFVTGDAKLGVILEVNSETDFVARNDKFQILVKNLAQHIASQKPANVEALLKQKYAALPSQTVQEAVAEAVATIGENLVLRRFQILEGGHVTAYLHGEGRIGVLVQLENGDSKLSAFAKDVAMHVAATNPLCVKSDELDANTIAKEREILIGKARETGKKEEMIGKIVEGQINKWKSEVCLLDQKFVKNPDQTVREYQTQVGKELSLAVAVKKFVRFELGEGIEKKKDDFASEVAAQLKAHQ
jgi:elongation factor Ts